MNISDVFACKEETEFYKYCLARTLYEHNHHNVVEMGSGDFIPVLDAVRMSGFSGRVTGFEISRSAFLLAKNNIASYKLEHVVDIRHESFFTFPKYKNELLISNPPYLPASDNDIILPEIYGGSDGADVIIKLLEIGYDDAFVFIPSISNPRRILTCIDSEGYAIRWAMCTALPFGKYTRQEKVMKHIVKMRYEYKAYFEGDFYSLMGVMLSKKINCKDTPIELCARLLGI